MTRMEVAFDADGTIRFDFENIPLDPQGTAGIVCLVLALTGREVPREERTMITQSTPNPTITHPTGVVVPLRTYMPRDDAFGGISSKDIVTPWLGQGFSPKRHGDATWCGGEARHGGHEFSGAISCQPKWCLGAPNITVPDMKAQGCEMCPNSEYPMIDFHPNWGPDHVVISEAPPNTFDIQPLTDVPPTCGNHEMCTCGRECDTP